MSQRGTNKRQRPIPVLSVALAGLLVGICLGIALHVNSRVQNIEPRVVATATTQP